MTGLGTVAEALAELAQNARLERSTPVPLDFETVEQEPASLPGHSLTITGVDRDDHGMRIRYTIWPPLSPQAGGPRGQGRDDHDEEYNDLGGAFGLAERVDRTTGVVTMPLPRLHAHTHRCFVRISWSHDSLSLWGRPAYELRITL